MISHKIRKNRASELSGGLEALGRAYPFNLSFYTLPPTRSVSLHDFEAYALARLKRNPPFPFTLLSTKLLKI
jgi:hypothetical protein